MTSPLVPWILLLQADAPSQCPSPPPCPQPPRLPPPPSAAAPAAVAAAAACLLAGVRDRVLARNTMTGVAAASFFSNSCRFGGCGLRFDRLTDLIAHIEDNHIDTDPRVLEKQELQQPTYVALSYINRFMTDAGRREQKKVQPKLSLSLTGAWPGAWPRPHGTAAAA
ncbi:hypothetical protein COCON_G00124690 [Conger conger]|uniref:C2H2-type domain-containing protein n=1 Tax=Conger conger TaxID=82655 RepID=A0A9Q1HWN7_CONCO|nr:hypothetical protein COCON_G00124690 [Conger conger]